jgi:hypothetical protein
MSIKAEELNAEIEKAKEYLKSEDIEPSGSYRQGHMHVSLPLLLADYASIRMQESNRWISVKERLPDEETIEVLALCGTSAYVLDFIRGENNESNFYLTINWPSRIFAQYTEFVTHWQPLPAPPSSEREEIKQ